MKKLFTFIIGIMLSVAISAQINYGIKLAGKELTSANAGAINNDNFPNLGLTNGTITYDHSTKTFTLNNVKANVSSESFLIITSSAEADNYKINLIGSNFINTETYSIYSYYNLSFSSLNSGSLYIASSNNVAIFITNNSTLSISNSILEVRGEDRGITGNDYTKGEKLIIENSTVKATGYWYGSICNFKNITIIDCEIIQPENAEVGSDGSGGQAVMLGGSVVTSEVVIEPHVYGIKIAGKDLTNENMGSIVNSEFPDLGLVEGTITYNHITRTFTLKNVKSYVASVSFMDIHGAYNVDEFRVNLIGDNIITTSASSISTICDMIIEGSGSLKLIANNGSGLAVKADATLTINNTTVEATGKWGGIKGYNEVSHEKLIIEKSTVKATGDDASIYLFENITLTDCEITQPEGAVIGNYGNNKQAVVLGGELVKIEVIITPKVGINDAELEAAFSIYPNPASNVLNIVSENANELIVISDLSGKIVYSEKTSENQTSINVSHLNVGMYIVRVGDKVTKFVKE